MAALAIGFIFGMIVELMVDNIHINDLYKKIDQLSMENEQLNNIIEENSIIIESGCSVTIPDGVNITQLVKRNDDVTRYLKPW